MNLFFKFLLFLTFSAQAYVPPVWMSLERVTDNHGSGVYILDQEVTLYPEAGEPVSIKEQWLINGSKDMRLRARGKRDLEEKLDLTYFYNGYSRTFVSKDGHKKLVNLGNDYFEDFFFSRNPEVLRRRLKKLKILPEKALSGELTFKSMEEVQHKPEEYVKLGRTGGVVSYVIGTPTPTNSEKFNPTAWIEQDAFVFRKIRMPSMVEVQGEDFQRHSAGLWMPHTREVRWQNNRAIIKVTQVSRSPYNSIYRKRLSSRAIDLKKEPHLKRTLPENALVKEFYSRFR